MAFIRRHRAILVPLFVAVLLGAGALFLLRSGSEEPGNGEPPEPVLTVQPWQERVELRNDHMREWRVVHEKRWVDPETGEEKRDELVSTVRERASSLCYRDAEGHWQPSVAEWEPGGLGFVMDRNNWRIEAPPTLGSACETTVDGKTLTARPRYIVWSDGARTVTLGEIDATVHGEIALDDPAKLVFADVLGAGSGVNIELVLERAALHQNVVFATPPALPDGLNAQTARLYMYTELGLDAFTADGSVAVKVGATAVDVSANDLATARNTDEPIAFTVDKERGGQVREVVLHQFVESSVWDSAASRNETCAARQLWRNPADAKTYLVESLPYSFLAAAEGAVTLDYESRSGDIDEDETWTADATYLVASDVNVGEGVCLTIEPGTVVKFDSGAINVTAADSKIVAQGEPYRYIVFTSKEDDNSGEDLTTGSTSGASGQYDEAMNIGSSAVAGCVVEFCKIGYATKAIVTAEDFGTIQHCIIRSCSSTAIYMTGSTMPDVFNNLIVNCGSGVVAYVTTNGPDFKVRNNTVDSCGSGIALTTNKIKAPWWSATFEIRNNLVSNLSTFGIYRNPPASWGTLTMSNNGYYNNSQNMFGVTDSAPVYPGANPYDTTNTQLGAHFIATGSYPGGSQLVNSGNGTFTSLYGDGAQFDIAAPGVVSSDVTSTTTWSKRSVDSGNVDIGYHHPRVDKVIAAARSIGGSNTVTLTINPGVVVAFAGSDARLQFKSDATASPTLTCNGTADDYIILAGKPLVSQNIEAQYITSSWWNYPHKGVLLNDVSGYDETASITYTRVMGMYKGIDIELDMDSNDAVRHCIFERGITGLYGVGAADRGVVVSNCLFHFNVRGAIWSLANSAAAVTLHNCTFDRNGINMVIEDCGSANVDVKDCLFSNAEEGIRLSAAVGTFVHDYNAFYECGTENAKMIWRSYAPTGAEDTGAHSLDLETSPYDPTWTDWADQWYLDQSGPCVNGGSRSAYTANLATFTTRLADADYDYGPVDIGYHHPTALDVSKTHFDNEAAGAAGEIDISYDYGGTVSNRVIRIYNSDGELVYEYAPSGEGTTIGLEGWDGTGNQGDYNGQDLDTGTYTVVVTADGDEYTRFRLYIEQEEDSSLEIQRPDDAETVDWL
jgi:hypothetical protein